MTIDEIITELSKTKLNEQNRAQIITLLSSFGKIAHSIITISSGLSITRARPHVDINEIFESTSDFSYKPQALNNAFQRASTPQRSMFYGSIIPDDKKSSIKEIAPPRIVTAMEALPWLRDPRNSGYRKISYGKWVTTDGLNLLAIIHEDQFEFNTEFAKEIIKQYREGLDSSGSELSEKSQKVYNLIAHEFSKEIKSNHLEYMISALFTETITTNYPEIDGILYPSVRALGRGFNVALTPKACEKLKLMATLECSIYKKEGEIRIDNDKFAQLTGIEQNFKYRLINNKQKLFLKELGFNTLDELQRYGNFHILK